MMTNLRAAGRKDFKDNQQRPERLEGKSRDQLQQEEKLVGKKRDQQRPEERLVGKKSDQQQQQDQLVGKKRDLQLVGKTAIKSTAGGEPLEDKTEKLSRAT
jgi:hypothetical protein